MSDLEKARYEALTLANMVKALLEVLASPEATLPVSQARAFDTIADEVIGKYGKGAKT